MLYFHIWFCIFILHIYSRDISRLSYNFCLLNQYFSQQKVISYVNIKLPFFLRNSDHKNSNIVAYLHLLFFSACREIPDCETMDWKDFLVVGSPFTCDLPLLLTPYCKLWNQVTVSVMASYMFLHPCCYSLWTLCPTAMKWASSVLTIFPIVHHYL